MKQLFAFLFGGIFAVGLTISGMANPENVLNFLDIFGTWDARLAFVMMGAICVAFIPFQKAIRQVNSTTFDGKDIELPKNTKIDSKLIIGSVLFGVGWGIAGICPAPSLTLLGFGHYEALYFILAMLLGMFIHGKFAGAD